MTYGVCNCVNPPSYGRCNACQIDFGPLPGTAPSPLAPATTPTPFFPAPEIHNHFGITAEEVRQIVREELAKVLSDDNREEQ